MRQKIPPSESVWIYFLAANKEEMPMSNENDKIIEKDNQSGKPAAANKEELDDKEADKVSGGWTWVVGGEPKT
jgi:hypothetical protein